MFTEAKRELSELVDLVRKIAAFDATMAANRRIQPEPSALERRRSWERRELELLAKYELLRST